MKQYFFGLLFFFYSSISLFAEDLQTHAYPLEQILAIAQDNAAQMEIIDTKIKEGYAEVASYRASSMPYISLGSNVSYVAQSYETQKMQQTMMIPFLSTPSTESTSSQQGSSFSSLEDLHHLRGLSYNWSITLQQPLITFGKVRSALKLARMRDCMLKDQRRLETDLFYLRVMQEFMTAYLAQLDVVINDAALQRSMQLQKRLGIEYSAGRAIRRDLLRVDALVQNDRVNCITASNIHKTSLKRLLQTINFGDSATVSLQLDEEGAMSQQPPPSGPGSVQLSLKRNEAAMFKQQAKRVRAGLFPNIDLVGSIGNQFMTIDTSGLIDKFVSADMSAEQYTYIAEAFDEANPGPENLFDPDFFNYAIGIQLTWTLFDGFRTSSQYRQAKLQAKQSLLELQEMDKDQKIAIEEAKNQVVAIDSSISAGYIQQQIAGQALEQTEMDYKDGMTDFSTLLETDKEFRTASRMLNGLKMQRVLALAQLRIVLGLPVYGEQK